MGMVGEGEEGEREGEEEQVREGVRLGKGLEHTRYDGDLSQCRKLSRLEQVRAVTLSKYKYLILSSCVSCITCISINFQRLYRRKVWFNQHII